MFSGLAPDQPAATRAEAWLRRLLPAKLWPRQLSPRRLWPRTLFGRSLLIVILPLLILQAVLAYVFYERHWDTVTRWLAVGVAGELGLLVQLLEEADNRDEHATALKLARNRLGFAV